jgi:hypothetical protein
MRHEAPNYRDSVRTDCMSCEFSCVGETHAYNTNILWCRKYLRDVHKAGICDSYVMH